jgi:O-antigen ligase
MHKIIYLITFFIYSGFNAVLVVLISIGMSNVTRIVTVPLRLVMTLLMIYLVSVFYLKRGKSSIKVRSIIFCFILFWLFYFLKVLLHYGFDYPLMMNWYEYILYAINFCVLPFLVFAKIDFKLHKKNILNSLLFSSFVMGVFSLYLYKDILMRGIGRISLAVYTDPSIKTVSPLALSYTGGLVITLCFYVYLFQVEKFTLWYKAYLISNFIMGFIMFYLGASRGSLVAIAFCIPVLYFFSNTRKKTNLIISIAVMIPFVIWGALKSGSSIFERTSNTSVKDGSTSMRLTLWRDAINEFFNNPIFGGRIEIDYYPHNIIFEILMSIGIIGFLPFIYFLVQTFLIGLKKIKLDKDYVWVLLVFIQGLVQSMFSGALYSSVLLFFGAGLLIAKSEYSGKFDQSRLQ